jgi:diaminopimelate decarboxylase
VDVFLRGAEILLEQTELFADLDFLDFGSGFKVPYKPEDYYTDVVELGDKLSDRFTGVSEKRWPGVIRPAGFEPGKILVSEAGTFLVKVNVLKQTTATVFVGAGLRVSTHLIPP